MSLAALKRKAAARNVKQSYPSGPLVGNCCNLKNGYRSNYMSSFNRMQKYVLGKGKGTSHCDDNTKINCCRHVFKVKKDRSQQHYLEKRGLTNAQLEDITNNDETACECIQSNKKGGPGCLTKDCKTKLTDSKNNNQCRDYLEVVKDYDMVTEKKKYCSLVNLSKDDNCEKKHF